MIKTIQERLKNIEEIKDTVSEFVEDLNTVMGEPVFSHESDIVYYKISNIKTPLLEVHIMTGRLDGFPVKLHCEIDTRLGFSAESVEELESSLSMFSNQSVITELLSIIKSKL